VPLPSTLNLLVALSTGCAVIASLLWLAFKPTANPRKKLA
jgi:hypothetical protein